MFKEFDHISIATKGTRELANWYCSILEFKVLLEMKKEPPIYFLKHNMGSMIEIVPASEKGSEERELEDPGFSHIGLLVDNFEKSEKFLNSKGIKLYGVRDTSRGWKIGYFKDPEGNWLQIVCRPKGIL